MWIRIATSSGIGDHSVANRGSRSLRQNQLMVPETVVAQLDWWQFAHRPPVPWLQALLVNNLVLAVRLAPSCRRSMLVDIVDVMVERLPVESYGSKRQLVYWCDRRYLGDLSFELFRDAMQLLRHHE